MEIKGKSAFPSDTIQQKEPIKVPGHPESAFKSSFMFCMPQYENCCPVIVEAIVDTVAEKQIPTGPALYKFVLFPDILISELAETLRGKLRVDLHKDSITQETNVFIVLEQYVVPNDATIGEMYAKFKDTDKWLYLNFFLV